MCRMRRVGHTGRAWRVGARHPPYCGDAPPVISSLNARSCRIHVDPLSQTLLPALLPSLLEYKVYFCFLTSVSHRLQLRK